jgi:hypothetical protein
MRHVFHRASAMSFPTKACRAQRRPVANEATGARQELKNSEKML